MKPGDIFSTTNYPENYDFGKAQCWHLEYQQDTVHKVIEYLKPPRSKIRENVRFQLIQIFIFSVCISSLFRVFCQITRNFF